MTRVSGTRTGPQNLLLRFDRDNPPQLRIKACIDDKPVTSAMTCKTTFGWPYRFTEAEAGLLRVRRPGWLMPANIQSALFHLTDTLQTVGTRCGVVASGIHETDKKGLLVFSSPLETALPESVPPTQAKALRQAIKRLARLQDGRQALIRKTNPLPLPPVSPGASMHPEAILLRGLGRGGVLLARGAKKGLGWNAYLRHRLRKREAEIQRQVDPLRALAGPVTVDVSGKTLLAERFVRRGRHGLKLNIISESERA